MLTLLPTGTQYIPDFLETRHHLCPQDRLNAVRKAAQGFRERFLDEPNVLFYRSIDLIRVPYPTWYGYSGVYAQSAYRFPFIHILNR
ncbi:MAG: hypothetical protein LPK85_09730, partial [Gammaproteobacteria bacterium]|nr:hypothetical protein [Gammaproteobacteria bacterium]